MPRQTPSVKIPYGWRLHDFKRHGVWSRIRQERGPPLTRASNGVRGPAKLRAWR